MAIYSKILPKSTSPVPTLFLDRDGVLIFDRDYLSTADGVAIIPGVSTALMAARDAGFQLIGISNQSGIGRGYFSHDDFKKVMVCIEEKFASDGVFFDGFYYCPHAPDDACNCRKPLPGLLEEAGLDFYCDPSKSWVIGDKLTDVRLGRNQGLGAFLVETGHGKQEKQRVLEEYGLDPLVGIAADLPEAVKAIISLVKAEADS